MSPSPIHLNTTDPVSIIAASLFAFILVFGLFSLIIKERIYLSDTLVALVFGIILGPAVTNCWRVDEWGINSDTVRFQFSRIVIAVQVMAAGVQLSKRYFLRKWRSLTVLLFPAMVISWMISATIIYLIFRLSFLEAMVLAACFAPTDPILANAIFRGKYANRHVPLHVRELLSAESGANDGLGFPYIFLGAFLLRDGYSVGASIWEWVYAIWVYKIVLSAVIGAVVGYAVRRALQIAKERDWIDKESFFATEIALALALMGIVALLGSKDLFAVFVAANAFSWDEWFRMETEDAHLQEIIDMLLALSFFVYLGATIPWTAIAAAGPGLVASCCVAVLVLRRLPAIFALRKFIPMLKTPREAIFVGWFGPVGIGAVFYAMEATKVLRNSNYTGWLVPPNVITPDMSPLQRAGGLWTLTSATVVASVIIHGFTVPFLLFAKKSHAELSTALARTMTSVTQRSRASSVYYRQSGGFKSWFKRRFRREDDVAIVILPDAPHLFRPTLPPRSDEKRDIVEGFFIQGSLDGAGVDVDIGGPSVTLNPEQYVVEASCMVHGKSEGVLLQESEAVLVHGTTTTLEIAGLSASRTISIETSPLIRNK